MNPTRNDALIKRKFYQYLLPGIMMVLALQAGDIIDSIIVAQLMGAEAMSAVTLCLPLLNVLQLVPFLMANGGTVWIANLLGQTETKKASKTRSVCLITGVAVSLFFAAITPLVIDPLSVLLSGSDPQMFAYVRQYALVNMLGIPLLSLSIMMANYLNVDNHPNLGSALFIIANIFNLFFDYVLIKYAGLGMYGTALATVLGYFIGLVVLIPYLRDKNRMLRLRRPSGHDFAVLKDVIKAGAPLFFFMLMTSLRDVSINSGVVRLLGVDSMTVYAICINSVLLVELLIGGIYGLLPTICGILYGEKDYFGIHALIRRVLKASIALSLALIAFFLVFPNIISTFFGLEEDALIALGNTSLRIYCLGFVFYSLNKCFQTYYQTILQPKLANISTILQGFAFIVPLSFALMLPFSLYGVCLAAVISELLSFIVVQILRIFWQRRGKLPQKGILMLPDSNPEDTFDYTVQGDVESAVGISQKIIDFCLGHQIDPKKSNALGVAAEELIANIGAYGKLTPKNNHIDLSLILQDDKIIFRIRDDGIPFDPTGWQRTDPSDDPNVSGLELVRLLCHDFTYTRVLNLNNTVIEMERA